MCTTVHKFGVRRIYFLFKRDKNIYIVIYFLFIQKNMNIY